uniref:Uncharacterized protein n=1 Tax=Cacopsylla melanoneura TaxID=428564 RepID=A0A8D9BRQ1_9HEMI
MFCMCFPCVNLRKSPIAAYHASIEPDSDTDEVISPRRVNLRKSPTVLNPTAPSHASIEPDSSDPVNVETYSNKTIRGPPPLIKIGGNRAAVASLSPTVSIPSPNDGSIASLSPLHNKSHNIATRSLYSVASLAPVAAPLSSIHTGPFSATNQLIDTPNSGFGFATVSPCKKSKFSEPAQDHTLSEDDDPFNPLILDIHSEDEDLIDIKPPIQSLLDVNTDNDTCNVFSPVISSINTDNDTCNAFSPLISNVSSLAENRADVLPAVYLEKRAVQPTTLVITNEGYKTVPTNALKKTTIQEYLDTQNEKQNECSSHFKSLKTESEMLFVQPGQVRMKRVQIYLEKLLKFIVDNPKEVMGFQKSYGECFISDMIPSFCPPGGTNQPVEFETANMIKSDLRAFFKNDFDEHAFTYFEASMGFPLEMCIICLEMRRKKKLLFLKFLNHFVVDHVEKFPDDKKCTYYDSIEMTLDKMKRTFRYMRTFGNCLMSFNIQKLIQENKQLALKADEHKNSKVKRGYTKRGIHKKNAPNKCNDQAKVNGSNDKNKLQTTAELTEVNNESAKEVVSQTQASKTIEDKLKIAADRKEKRAQARERFRHEKLKRRGELIKEGRIVKKNSRKRQNPKQEMSEDFNNGSIIVTDTAKSKTKQSKSETESLDNESKTQNESTESNIKENNTEVDKTAELESEKHEVCTATMDKETVSNSEICGTNQSCSLPIKQEVTDEVESASIAVKEECNSPNKHVDNSDDDSDGSECLLKIYEEIDLISVHDSDADTPDELDEETDEFVERTDEEPVNQNQSKSDKEDEVSELDYCEQSQEMEPIRVQSIKDEVVDKILEQKDAERTTRRHRKVRKRKKSKKDDTSESEESDEDSVDSIKKKKRKSNAEKKSNKEVDKRIMDILAAARKEMEEEEEREKEIEQLSIIQIPSKTYENKKKADADDDYSVRIPSKSYEKKPQKAIKTYSKKEPVSNILYSAYVSMIRMITLDKETVSNNETSNTNSNVSRKQEVESIKLFEYFDDEFNEIIFNTEDEICVESKSQDGIDLCTDQYNPVDFITLETEPLLNTEMFGIFPKVSDESCNANLYTSHLVTDVFVKTEIKEEISQSSFERSETSDETATVEKIASEFDELFDPSAKYDSYCQILRVTKRKSVESSPTDSNCENINLSVVKYPEFNNKRRKIETNTENSEISHCQDMDKECDKDEVIELEIKQEIEDSCHVETKQTPTKVKTYTNSKTLHCQGNALLESSKNELIELELIKEEIDEICHVETNQTKLAQEKTPNMVASFRDIECDQFVFNVVQEEFQENVEMSVEDLKIESDPWVSDINKIPEFSNDDNEPIIIDVSEDIDEPLDTNEALINDTDAIRDQVVRSIEDKFKINAIKDEVVPIEDNTVSNQQPASFMKLPVTKESFVRIYKFVTYYSQTHINQYSVGYLMSLFKNNKDNQPSDCVILEVILNEVTKDRRNTNRNLFFRAKLFLEKNFDVQKLCGVKKLGPPKRCRVTQRVKKMLTEINLTEYEYRQMRTCKVALDRLSAEFLEKKNIKMSSESWSSLIDAVSK